MSKTTEKDRLLVAIDPVSCGSPPWKAALEGLDPGGHALTMLVLAGVPPSTAAAADDGADLAYSDSVLPPYRQTTAQAGGFDVEAWETPNRQDQIVREVERSGPYDTAVAVVPSRRLRRNRDITQLLESVGNETSLQCVR